MKSYYYEAIDGTGYALNTIGSGKRAKHVLLKTIREGCYNPVGTFRDPAQAIAEAHKLEKEAQ